MTPSRQLLIAFWLFVLAISREQVLRLFRYLGGCLFVSEQLQNGVPRRGVVRFRQDLTVVSKVLFVNVAIHSKPRSLMREPAELPVTESCHRRGGDIASMRVGDPDVLINTAHVVQKKCVTAITGIGTFRTLATSGARAPRRSIVL